MDESGYSIEDKLKEDGVDEGLHHFDFADKVSRSEFDEKIRALENRQNPERIIGFWQTLSKASSEAQDVVKLVFDTPRELVQMIALKRKQPYMTAACLKKYLRKKLKWRASTINRVFKELKKLV